MFVTGSQWVLFAEREFLIRLLRYRGNKYYKVCLKGNFFLTCNCTTTIQPRTKEDMLAASEKYFFIFIGKIRLVSIQIRLIKLSNLQPIQGVAL